MEFEPQRHFRPYGSVGAKVTSESKRSFTIMCMRALTTPGDVIKRFIDGVANEDDACIALFEQLVGEIEKTDERLSETDIETAWALIEEAAVFELGD